jgi:hypothetical protein
VRSFAQRFPLCPHLCLDVIYTCAYFDACRYVSVSQDHEFLRQSLAPVLVDEFTSKLWGIYCRVREKVGSSQPMLAVTRSDYMLSRAPVGGPFVAGIKQIEFNSLSVGGLPWTTKVACMHSYLSNRYPHAIDDFSPAQSHPSPALSEVAQAIGAALNAYCLKHGIEPKHACVLHIQGHSKYAHNVTDQEVPSCARVLPRTDARVQFTLLLRGWKWKL